MKAKVQRQISTLQKQNSQMSSHKDQIAYSLFSHHVTDNYAMACEPEVSHAGGQAAGRVV